MSESKVNPDAILEMDGFEYKLRFSFVAMMRLEEADIVIASADDVKGMGAGLLVGLIWAMMGVYHPDIDRATIANMLDANRHQFPKILETVTDAMAVGSAELNPEAAAESNAA